MTKGVEADFGFEAICSLHDKNIKFSKYAHVKKKLLLKRTIDACWNRMKEETKNRSKYHLEFAENLKTLVENPILNFVKEKAKQRKKVRKRFCSSFLF